MVPFLYVLDQNEMNRIINQLRLCVRIYLRDIPIKKGVSSDRAMSAHSTPFARRYDEADRASKTTLKPPLSVVVPYVSF